MNTVHKTPVVIPLTVLVPSYRRKHFLARALGSVNAQLDVKPLEVIVVDDGSNDGTAELARSFGARVIQKTTNEGLAPARDDAVRAADGAEWLALLDDDDQWLPHHLRTVWAQRAGHVMVAGTSVTFGGDSPSRAHGTPTDAPEVVRSPSRLVFPENSFTTSATIVRRDVLLAAGSFDRELRYLEDIDAWLRVLEHGTGVLLPDVTCLYRLHRGQMSKNRDAMQEWGVRVLDKYEGRPWLTEARRRLAVVDCWDDLQAARGAGQRQVAAQKAAWIIRDPRRWEALVRLWIFRRQVRNRTIGGDALAAAARAAAAGEGLTSVAEKAPVATGAGAPELGPDAPVPTGETGREGGAGA